MKKENKKKIEDEEQKMFIDAVLDDPKDTEDTEDEGEN